MLVILGRKKKSYNSLFLQVLKMLAIIATGLVAIIAGLLYTYVIKTPKMPCPETKWWGIGARPDDEDDSIKPFKIAFTDTVSFKL